MGDRYQEEPSGRQSVGESARGHHRGARGEEHEEQHAERLRGEGPPHGRRRELGAKRWHTQDKQVVVERLLHECPSTQRE